jgi:endonuclease YncB( thermonuclease family)
MPKLLVLCLVVALIAGQAVARTITGTVIQVIDGDTVEVLVDHVPVRVRLAAIDAPEIGYGRDDPGQPYGQAARQSLANLIARRAVTIYDEGTDQYGLMLGTVYDGPANINARQVSQGMAWVYRDYSHDPVLMWLEYQARVAKRGLWADPHPVPPWEYRRSKPRPGGSSGSTGSRHSSPQTTDSHSPPMS